MRILAGVGTGEDTGLPPDGSPVKITGRIDTRSSEEIILKSISIIQNDQEYSYSGKLQCELENMKTAMITAGAVTEEDSSLFLKYPSFSFCISSENTAIPCIA